MEKILNGIKKQTFRKYGQLKRTEIASLAQNENQTFNNFHFNNK